VDVSIEGLAMVSCLICKGSNPVEVVLRDGTVIHEQCLKLDLSALKKSAMIRIQSHYQELKGLRPNYSFLESFFGNKAEDARIDKERNRINAAIEASKEELKQLIAREEKHSQIYAVEIERAISLWPGYPPEEFWQELQDKARRLANWRCKDCSRYLKYHGDVHHKIPLRLGGLNVVDNLQLLCKSCHENHSGGIIGDPGPSVDKSTDYVFLNVKQRLDLALSMKKNVHLVYTNEKGDMTKRWVTIERIFGIGKLDKIQMIEGYCHLRNDTRIFRVDRISKADVFGMQ